MSLQKIREKQKARDAQSSKDYGAPTELYKFWNAPADGVSTIIRLLPNPADADDEFWVESFMNIIPFGSYKYTDADGDVQEVTQDFKILLPCADTWERKTCPIQKDVYKMYKDGDKDEGKKYWRITSYYYQALVVKSNMDEEDDSFKNKIRIIKLNKSLHKKIIDHLTDEDREDDDDLPTDYKVGRDFLIKKTKTGDYADYSTSKFREKTRELSPEELNILNDNPLYNLNDYIGSRPSQEDMDTQYKIFQASRNEEPYDLDQYRHIFDPSKITQQE